MQAINLPDFTPALPGFRNDEFLTLTETLLAFPIEQDQARLDAAPFRLERPEPLPELPMEPLPPRWYPRPADEVIEAARAALVPPPRPAVLEGRANELARVLRPLLAGHPVQVRGEPGVGKTALLASIATHERTRQRFRRIWWFDQPARVEQTLALALNLPHILANPDPDARRARLTGTLDDHTLLLVDNVPDGDPVLDRLAELTPHLLVAVETAPEIPDPDEPRPEDPDGVITLHVLDDSAAIDALAAHAGITDTRRIRARLLQIATALGHHPYALVLAGQLARRDGLSLEELEDSLALDSLLQALADSAARDDVDSEGDDAEASEDEDEADTDADAETEAGVSGEAGPEAGGAPQPDHDAPEVDLPAHLISLNRALDVTVAALPGDYARLVKAFGAFPPAGAPFDGLHDVARLSSPLATRRGLIVLAEYGLIWRDHRQPDHYIMHPVAYAHAEDDEHPAQSKIGKRVRAWALRYVRAHATDPLALYRAEYALRHAYRQAQAHGPTHVAGPLADALRPYLREYAPDQLTGENATAPPPLVGARAEAAALTETGLALTDEGAALAAEAALTQALELRRAYDSPHAIAETLLALGRLYDASGDYEQAVEVLIEAAELVYNLGAEDSLSVVRRGLARAYRHLGRLNDALGVLDDAPEAHLERAAILRTMGNYAAAVDEMAQAGQATPYARAEIFVLAGRYADALAAIADADDPASAQLRAQVFHLQGTVDEAIEGYQRALDAFEEEAPDSDDSGGEAGTPPHTRTRAKTLRGLGAACATGGDYERARDCLSAALALEESLDPPDRLRLGRTLRLLAAVELASGDPAAAAAGAKDALERLNGAPEDAAEAARTLGRALWRIGDHAAALDAFLQEMEFAQSVPERDETRIGMALHHVAAAHEATGELDRAIANYRRALTHHSSAVDHHAVLITQIALHRALMAAGRIQAALDLSQEIVDQLGQRRGVDLAHYGYAQTLRARTQQAVERPIRAAQSVQEWARYLATRADEAVTDPRPAVRTLITGLAARSLLAANRPEEALNAALAGEAVAMEHYADTPAAWAATRDLGEAYLAVGEPEDAVLTLDSLLNEGVRAHPPTFASAHELTARAYRQLGEPGNALAHFKVALQFEPDDHRRGLLHEAIGRIQIDIGQPAEAVESLQAALPLLERKEHPDITARTLTTLARTLGGLNRYAEAIGVYEEALVVLREVAGVDPVHTADVLFSLGQTHEAQGQLAEAGRVYRRALNVLERTAAPHQTRDALLQLARVTAAQGDPNAVMVYEQTREATEKIGTGHELAEVLCELGDVHRDAGRLLPAVQNYQSALDSLPVPPFARERAAALRSLGRAYAQMERYDEARTVWTEALALSQESDESPVEIALTHHAIGEAYRSQNHFADAGRAFTEALRHHQPGTVAAADTWRSLGMTLHGAGHPAKAIEPLQRALEAEKAQPQQANARLVHTLQLLAAAHEDNRDLEAAIARHHEALVYMDRALQPVAYADTLRTLGGLYIDHQNFVQAQQALQEALEIENSATPRSDERISGTLQAIADAYRTQGDLAKAAEYYQRVTVYANLARRASEDLRETLDELDRRRATLQAAQQSLALLDRNDEADLKDMAFIYALIAFSHAQLNEPENCAAVVDTLLDVLDARRSDLDRDDARADYRALAWLAAVRQAETDGDPASAKAACESALATVTNVNLRWLIRQVAHSFSNH